MNKTHATKPLIRNLAATAAILAGGLSLSACGTGPFSSNMDKTESHAWPSASDAGAKKIAPDWIPASATDLKEQVRTTGNERILSYAGTIADLPSTCTALPAGTKPAPRPDDADSAPADFLGTATLEADWWPAGQEAKTTAMCGKWWVSGAGARVYAFTPELKAVADRLK